jgi:hypothetical protein
VLDDRNVDLLEEGTDADRGIHVRPFEIELTNSSVKAIKILGCRVGKAQASRRGYKGDEQRRRGGETAWIHSKTSCKD